MSLGTPHASRDELERYVAILDGRRVAASVECLVSTGRDVLESAPDIASDLAAAGVELLVDTCSYIAPILRGTERRGDDRLGQVGVLRPGQHRCDGGARLDRDCVRVGSRRHVVRDDSAWGAA